MSWHTGLHRLRIVGTVALLLGVLSCAAVLVTRSMGYAPDPSFASLFAALWPAGLVLVLLGGLLWLAVWVLHGFVLPTPVAIGEREPISRGVRLDP